MRTRAYGDAERPIKAADTSGIRERWLYGLRLINDPDILAPAGGLKHGVAARLIEVAARRGVKLSEREIQYRIQVARKYPKDSQIRTACADFETWSDLRSANFPAYEADPGEPDADWRTKAERDHANAQQLLDLVGEQGALFPYDFEPAETSLKDLVAYAEEQAALTDRFAERDRKRAAYLEELRAAVEDDLSASWRDAHVAAFGEEPDGSPTPDDA